MNRAVFSALVFFVLITGAALGQEKVAIAVAAKDFSNPGEIEEVTKKAVASYATAFTSPAKAQRFLRVQLDKVEEIGSWEEYQFPDQPSLKEQIKDQAIVEGAYAAGDLAYFIPRVGYVVARMGYGVAYRLERQKAEKYARAYTPIVFSSRRERVTFWVIRFDRQPDGSWGEAGVTTFVQDYTIVTQLTETFGPPQLQVRRVVNHQEQPPIAIDHDWQSWIIADAVSTALGGGN